MSNLSQLSSLICSPTSLTTTVLLLILKVRSDGHFSCPYFYCSLDSFGKCFNSKLQQNSLMCWLLTVRLDWTCSLNLLGYQRWLAASSANSEKQFPLEGSSFSRLVSCSLRVSIIRFSKRDLLWQPSSLPIFANCIFSVILLNLTSNRTTIFRAGRNNEHELRI